MTWHIWERLFCAALNSTLGFIKMGQLEKQIGWGLNLDAEEPIKGRWQAGDQSCPWATMLSHIREMQTDEGELQYMWGNFTSLQLNKRKQSYQTAFSRVLGFLWFPLSSAFDSSLSCHSSSHYTSETNAKKNTFPWINFFPPLWSSKLRQRCQPLLAQWHNRATVQNLQQLKKVHVKVRVRQLKCVVQVTPPFNMLEERNTWGSARQKRGWECDAWILKSMCVCSSLCEYASEREREIERERGRLRERDGERAVCRMSIQPPFFYFFPLLSQFRVHTYMFDLGNINFISFLVVINIYIKQFVSLLHTILLKILLRLKRMIWGLSRHIWRQDYWSLHLLLTTMTTQM